MAKILKVIGIVAAILVGLIILVVVIVNLIPGAYYKTLISSSVRSATGRELVIEGDLDIKLFSSLAFKASGIKFSNAEWSSLPHMVSVDHIEGELALFPLLSGIIDVTLVVDKPDLLLETNSSRQGNWQFGDLAEDTEEETESGGGLPLRPLIRKLHLNGTRIAFLDGKSGEQFDIHSEKLHVRTTEDGLTVEVTGKFNDIPLALSGGLDNAEFFIDNQPAKVKFGGYFGDAKLVVQGTAGPLSPTFDLDVTLAMDTDSVAAFSPLVGKDLPNLGPLAVSAKLIGKEGKYAINDLFTTLNAEKLSVEAKGSVADLTALSGLNLEAKVNTVHLTEILKAVGFESQYPLPDLLNVKIMAEGSMKELAVNQFHVKIQGQGLNATANGKVKNIIALEGVQVDVSLETESLDLIAEIAKTKPPPLGPLKVTASVVSKGQNLGLMEITANLIGETIHANVAGSIEDPLKIKEINADVDFGIESLAWVSDYINMKLPPLGSLTASANIASKGDTFEMKDIKVNLTGENIQAEVAGSVGDMLKVQGIDAKVELGVQSLAFVSDYVQMELPPLGSLTASANISSKGDTFEIKDIKATLAGENIQAEVAGSVGDLLKVRGVNATVDLGVKSLAFLSDYIKMELPPFAPLKVAARIVSKGKNLGPMEITANLIGKTIHANVAGSIEDPLKIKAINVDVDLGIESLTWLSDYINLELPPLGALTASANIASIGDTFEVKDIKATLAGENIRAEVAGSIGDLLKVQGVNVTADLGVKSLYFLSDYTKMELPPLGPLKATASIASKGDTFEITNLKADLAGRGIQMNVAGSVGDLLKLKAINTDIDFRLESLSVLSNVAKMELPLYGPLKVTANVVSNGENLGLMEIKANLSGKGIHANIEGSVDDLIELKTINADVDLEINSLALLSEYVGTDLSSLGPLQASATLTSKGKTFELRNIKANLTGKKIQPNATGSIRDLQKLKEIKTDVHPGIVSLDLFSKHVGVKHPPPGPLSASASIASKGETFGVKDIEADLAGEKIQATVAGSVENLLKLTGINADINFAVDSLASLGPLVKQDLPVSGPVALEGSFFSEGGLDSPISIATVVKSDGVTVNFTGSIAEPLAAKGIDLAIAVEADSMQKVGKLTGVQFQGKKPIKLKGKFIAGENTYELAGLHLQVGELDVKGQAAFKQPSEPGDRPQVSGKLHVGALDLSKQQVKADTSAETESSPESKEEVIKKDKIFSSEPLPFGALKAVDADIEVTIERLTTLELQLEDLVVGLTLDNGFLNLKPIKANVGHGTFDGVVTLDMRNKPASLTADVEMTDATFRYFGGKIHFLADIDGSGDSIAAIMADIDGQLEFDIRDVAFKKSLMTGFGSGILDSLNPFNKNKEETELICAIILFDIEDGVADANHKIAAQMTDVTWFGSGTINFETEEIDFGMSPKPRKGFGFSLGSLSKLVHLGGTLAKPKVELDPKDMAVKYGKYSLGVATGGLTWVADLLWSKIKSNADVCDKILEELDSKRAAKDKKSE